MRIAFFTFNAYEMLTGGHGSDAIGGAQLQQILIGKELARRGHEVFFVEYNKNGLNEQTVEGITIVTMPRPTGSTPVRAFDVFTNILRVLRKISPDVCYRRVLDFSIIPLSIACSLTGRRFVYNIAHDDELTNKPHMFSTGLKSTLPYRWINRLALSNANAVIAQNSHQRRLAESVLSTNIHHIPNCYPNCPVDPIDWEYSSPVVFWAARFQQWKQPNIVAELAADLPEVTFVMAGSPGDENLFNRLKEHSESLNNIDVLGHIPFSKIDHYFAAADLFLNTSKFEGFPNTFLQAWAHETPVVSLQVDPDNILSSEKIGFVADGSIERLREYIDSITENPNRLTKIGQASYAYLEEHHTVEVITDRYEQVFLDKNTLD